MIAGGAGDDKIDAGAGNDTNVHGNDGNDIVNGGPGADNLFGDAHNDIVSAGPGEIGSSVDELTGGPGERHAQCRRRRRQAVGRRGRLSFSCTADAGNDGSSAVASAAGTP